MEQIFLLFIVFFAITLYVRWKLPAWIGKTGENFVSRKLRKLDPAYYRVLNDVLIPSQGNTRTTQIDHIVISNFGIFCIETKSYKGWIFGSAGADRWTQVLYNYKKRFFNPLRQNFAHVKAIENLVGENRLKAPVISLVAFPRAGKIKVSGTDKVGYAAYVVEKILSYRTHFYSDMERDGIYEIFMAKNIVDKLLRKIHIKEVRALSRF